MYRKYYNLTAKPFPEKADPDHLWLTEKAKEALTTFRNSITENKGILLLTGDVGSGKTSFVNRLINSFSENIIVGNVVNSGFNQLEFLQVVAEAFRLKKKVTDQNKFLDYFKRFLTSATVAGKKILLIVDEAQQLSTDLLHLIQILADTDVNGLKLLNILLVGQNEFNTILFLPENSELRQKIAITYNIPPLTRSDTENYIKYHLRLAHGDENIFSPEAITEIFAFANGSPRLINLICDLAMLNGYTQEQQTISGKIISDCVKNLLLPNERNKSFQPLVAQRAQEFWQQTIDHQQKTSGWLKPRYIVLIFLVLVGVGAGQFYLELSDTNDAAPEIEEPASIFPPNAESARPEPPPAEDDAMEAAVEQHPKPSATLAALGSDRQALPAADRKSEEISTDVEKQLAQISSPSEISPTSVIEAKEKMFPDIGTSPFTRAGKKVIMDGNLRSKPSADSDVITVVKKGQSVTEIRRKNNWYFVKVADGRLGWMHNTLFLAGEDHEKARIAIAPVKAVEEKPLDIQESHTKTSVKQKTASTSAPGVPKEKSEQKPPSPPVAASVAAPVPPPRLEARDLKKSPVSTASAAKPKPTVAGDSSAKKETRDSTPEPDIVRTHNPDAIEWSQKSFESVSQKLYSLAIEQASKAIALDPGLASPYINRAWAYSETGLYDKAVADCTTVLKIDPKNALAYNNRGLAYHRMGELGQAEANYKEGCRRNIETSCQNLEMVRTQRAVRDLLDNSRAAMKRKDWDKAMQAVDEALERDPGNQEALTLQAAIKGEETRQEDGLAWLQKSEESYAKGRYPQAVEEAATALKADPALAAAYIARAQAYTKTKEYDRALADSKAALALEPDNNLALSIQAFNEDKVRQQTALEYSQLSFEYVSQGSYSEAIEAATKALALDDTLLNPYINRAWAYSETGLYSKAIDDCNSALAMEPDNALALNNLGLVYHRMGKFITAEEYYRKACDQKLDVACNNLKNLYSSK
jgi:type II secretory pathway predicted ATPase ExeA/tetratricopeptide (TPR) repeat protein